jgi:hypothetical protein
MPADGSCRADDLEKPDVTDFATFDGMMFDAQFRGVAGGSYKR